MIEHILSIYHIQSPDDNN